MKYLTIMLSLLLFSPTVVSAQHNTAPSSQNIVHFDGYLYHVSLKIDEKYKKYKHTNFLIFYSKEPVSDVKFKMKKGKYHFKNESLVLVFNSSAPDFVLSAFGMKDETKTWHDNYIDYFKAYGGPRIKGKRFSKVKSFIPNRIKFDAVPYQVVEEKTGVPLRKMEFPGADPVSGIYPDEVGSSNPYYLLLKFYPVEE